MTMGVSWESPIEFYGGLMEGIMEGIMRVSWGYHEVQWGYHGGTMGIMRVSLGYHGVSLVYHWGAMGLPGGYHGDTMGVILVLLSCMCGGFGKHPAFQASSVKGGVMIHVCFAK